MLQNNFKTYHKQVAKCTDRGMYTRELLLWKLLETTVTIDNEMTYCVAEIYVAEAS